MSQYAGQTYTAHIPFGHGADRPPLDDDTRTFLIDAALEAGAEAHGCGWESWRVSEDGFRSPAQMTTCGQDGNPEHDHTEDCWALAFDENGRQLWNWALILKAVAT